MARRKRSSESVDRAETRASAIESINPALDLGNGLTLVDYKAAISATNAKLSVYNTRLSELDGLLNELEIAEDALHELSSRMLAAVGVKFGKDSTEYEKAGGKRSSERKSSRRAAAAPAVAAAG